MLQDVVRSGTGARASALGRSDLAGKTGTTNDFKDAWFVGYNPKVVTAVYVGYDKPASMGRRGFGGTLALPIWVDYMRFALKGMPIQSFNKGSGGSKKDTAAAPPPRPKKRKAADEGSDTPPPPKRKTKPATEVTGED